MVKNYIIIEYKLSNVSFCSTVNFILTKIANTRNDRRHGVAQLVGTLRYKPEGHGFDPDIGIENFL